MIPFPEICSALLAFIEFMQCGARCPAHRGWCTGRGTVRIQYQFARVGLELAMMCNEFEAVHEVLFCGSDDGDHGM